MHNDQPIGMFDSGLGGISIWQEVVQGLPNEYIIYYADSGNAPYGPRPYEEITRFSERIIEFFIKKNCKAVVIACNTATLVAGETLKERFDIPLIGTTPPVDVAASHTATNSIGVMATEGTLINPRLIDRLEALPKEISITTQPGIELVEIVEEQRIHTRATRDLLSSYIAPMLNQQADQIVLGCTHYPFLLPVLETLVPNGVQFVNPAQQVAQKTKAVLEARQLMNKTLPTNVNDLSNTRKTSQYEFYTSGDKRILADFLKAHTLLPFEVYEKKLNTSF